MKPTPGNDRDHAAVEAEAMEWLSERDEGFAPGRAAVFEAWRHRDPRHAAAVAELEEVIAQLDSLAPRRDAVNAHFGRTSPPRPVAGFSPAPAWLGWRSLAWGAAAAALLVGGFFGSQAWRAPAAPETRYATTAAGYERARLEDGSTLELNTASVARVRFTPAERHVELESGEAHFEVARDPARPFFVHAGGVAVRAVGTAFNVRFAAGGGVEVIVTEGKVSVLGASPAPAVGPSTAQPGSPPSGSPTLVAAGERLLLPSSATRPAVTPAPAIEHLAPATVRAALAWQRRATDFSDTPLAEVAARFNRHHTHQLVIADPALGARRISGIFALDDVEAFVRLLEGDGIVRAEREGDTVRLLAP